MEGDIVVVVFQWRGGRQNDVRVAGGLIQVGVQRHHEFQLFQRLVQFAAVGGGKHGVASTGEQCANLAFAGGGDFLCHGRGGQLPVKFRQAAHPAVVAPEAAGADIAHLVYRRQRKERATGPVEIAGGDIDQLDQPLVKYTVGLGGNAHAAVANAGFCLREFAGNAAHIPGADAGVFLGELRGERGYIQRHFLEAGNKRGEMARPHQVFGEDRIEYRQQKQCIGTRGNEVVLTCQLRCFGASRVDEYQLAAAGLKILDPLFHIRHRPDTAVGGNRVGAQHQKVVAAVDIGNRKQ